MTHDYLPSGPSWWILVTANPACIALPPRQPCQVSDIMLHRNLDIVGINSRKLRLSDVALAGSLNCCYFSAVLCGSKRRSLVAVVEINGDLFLRIRLLYL